MTSRRATGDRRGELSEMAAVGVLVGITLLMTLSGGLYVVATQGSSGPPPINFSYDYDDNADSLIVRYADGPPLTAGEVIITSRDHSVRWHQLGLIEANGTFEPGKAIQLSENNAWGGPVTGVANIEIYVDRGGNRTLVSNWSADS